uniref:hypothetical protein n=1 Tax=Citrobacter freundii TaxID=546 RepID=UPI001F5BEF54|nr:hypothetical protein [Citrobacter freundii]
MACNFTSDLRIKVLRAGARRLAGYGVAVLQHKNAEGQQFEQHELRIVSLDVPTSWQALSDKEPAQNDPITRAVITAINNMLIDLMAAMSHKDWLSRRLRQKQGIERAHTQGKYRGKQADSERHQKVMYYRQVKKLSIQETAEATGYSCSQVCRIQALHKITGAD